MRKERHLLDGNTAMDKMDDDKAEKCAMVEMPEIRENLGKGFMDQEENEFLRPIPQAMDMNLYATNKTIAEGLMDIALLTANATHLKRIMKEGTESPFHAINAFCLAISIILQIAVGVLLILGSRYNINLTSHQRNAERINHLTIIGAFFITIANVFLSTFGI